MDRRHIAPVGKLRVPDHQRGGYLPAKGRTVLWDMRWQRQHDDGSIRVVEPKAEKTTKGKG